MVELLEHEAQCIEDTQRNKFLIFISGNEEFGIEIKYVTEIVGLQSIIEIPELPSFVKGVINLRGKIIPVIDVRLRFKKEPIKYNDRTCTVVIDVNDVSIGLIVDTVSEVLSIFGSDIVPPPQLISGYYHKYIKGIGKVDGNIKLILDCEKLICSGEIQSLYNLI